MHRNEGSAVTEVLSEIPAGYHESRREWWSTNSHFWATYVDSTSGRKQLLHAQAQIAGNLCQGRVPIRIVDCGCGEGMFLRVLDTKLDGVHLVGLDFCDKMIAQAAERSRWHAPRIAFAQVDLEAPADRLTESFDMAVASLVLDEVEDLDAALAHIAGLVVPGGHVLLTVLDADAERQKLISAAETSSALLGDASPSLLVLKRFWIGIHASPAPYCRLIRAASIYAGAAERAGLSKVREETWKSTVIPDETVYRFLLFSKAL